MTATAAATASDLIIAEVTSWPGIVAMTGTRGELSFRFARREIGHLHGDRSAHFAFPKPIWDELFSEGRIDYHPVFPGRRGPAARRIQGPEDVQDIIALLRLNYDRFVRR
jgi:hypothetical protein